MLTGTRRPIAAAALAVLLLALSLLPAGRRSGSAPTLAQGPDPTPVGPPRTPQFRFAVWLIVLAALFSAILSSSGDTSAQIPPVANSTPAMRSKLVPPFPTRGSVINNTTPPRRSSDVPLSNAELRGDVDNFVHSRPLAPDLGAQNQFTRVEVIHSLPASQMKDAMPSPLLRFRA